MKERRTDRHQQAANLYGYDRRFAPEYYRETYEGGES
jgi:hypothetical protein